MHPFVNLVFPNRVAFTSTSFVQPRCKCFYFEFMDSIDMRWLPGGLQVSNSVGRSKAFSPLRQLKPLQVYKRNVQTWQQVVLVLTAFVSNCRAWTNLNFVVAILYDCVQRFPQALQTAAYRLSFKQISPSFCFFLITRPTGFRSVEKERPGFVVSNLYGSNVFAERFPFHIKSVHVDDSNNIC